VLLVRPSGIKNFYEVYPALEKRDFELGFDTLGTTQTVIPTAGDKP
jgi:hypothetical protein